ncbi:nitroreductase family deazaflavin-dependent oxidoreductase [Saccharopolyspora taberi]|uniref:Nitroreductase family deazaflavin-dependent oxidoreductase n=1 Tax=Saccharopolyspora taberi TaxID=60895 RepID=A0ABN3V1W9_9PSEU
MEIVGRPQPPTGLARVLFRLPIRLYRLRLGWLLGGRFVLINHVGRRSGKPRQAVVEVVERDGDSCVVASGFGARADWYRNVLAQPDVTIRIGTRELEVRAVALSTEDGGELMARYAGRHPAAARKLCRFMGFAVDGSESDFREVGRGIPFLRFVPR